MIQVYNRMLSCWNVSPMHREWNDNTMGCRISSICCVIVSVQRMTTRGVLLSNEMTPQTIIPGWLAGDSQVTSALLSGTWPDTSLLVHGSHFKARLIDESRSTPVNKIPGRTNVTPLQTFLSVCIGKKHSE